MPTRSCRVTDMHLYRIPTYIDFYINSKKLSDSQQKVTISLKEEVTDSVLFLKEFTWNCKEQTLKQAYWENVKLPIHHDIFDRRYREYLETVIRDCLYERYKND